MGAGDFGQHAGPHGPWGELIHGTTQDGLPVTVRFGQGNLEGHTLIADGYITHQQHQGNSQAKGHDHADGLGGYRDRQQFSG